MAVISEKQRQVDAFNHWFKPGDKVRIMKDDSRIQECTLKWPASFLWNECPVIWLNEIKGCYALDRAVDFSPTYSKAPYE